MRLFICAGEASGDRLGAALVTHLRSQVEVVAMGMAGPRMRAAGVEAIASAEEATALGLVEVVAKLPELARLGHRLGLAIRRFRPDLVLTIDSPGLLLRVARRARRDGFPVVHWGCPQVWAWRRGRISQVVDAADVLLCQFPFEPALFRDTPLLAHFVGHPAAAARPLPAPERIRFLLAPGSRPEELRRHWPVCRRVAQRLRIRFPDCELVVPVAPGLPREAFAGLDVTLADGWPAAHVALVASGTATLELAALGIPMVVFYRVHPVTWAVARRWVTGVGHVALPNILAGRCVVPEFLQTLNPAKLADQMHTLLGPAGDLQRSALQDVVSGLEGDAAIARVGQIVTALARRELIT